MSLPWWCDGTLYWDVLILGGEVYPGLATVTGSVERNLDIQTKKGSDGATIADNGYVPAPLNIAIRLWLQEQWDAWVEILPELHPRNAGGLRQPLEIIHPAANLIGINQIYIRKIAAPVIDANRAATITIEAIQWFPEPKKAKTSKKPKTSSNFDPADYDVPGPSQDGSASSF